MLGKVLSDWAAPIVKKRREDQEAKERNNDEKRRRFVAELQELEIYAGLPYDASRFETIDDVDWLKDTLHQIRPAAQVGQMNK